MIKTPKLLQDKSINLAPLPFLTLEIQGSVIKILTGKEQGHISLTDMVRNIENGSILIEKWLRNKNTIEFVRIWEEIYNPDFNSP